MQSWAKTIRVILVFKVLFQFIATFPNLVRFIILHGSVHFWVSVSLLEFQSQYGMPGSVVLGVSTMNKIKDFNANVAILHKLLAYQNLARKSSNQSSPYDDPKWSNLPISLPANSTIQQVPKTSLQTLLGRDN